MNNQDPLDVMNGHPLRVERCRRNLTQAELADRVKVSVTTIWRAETDCPINAGSRQRLCAYFGMTSLELGLTERNRKTKRPTRKAFSLSNTDTTTGDAHASKDFPIVMTKQSPSLHMVLEHPTDTTPEQHMGAWLALESCQIASLFDAGWTLDAILDSLRVVLQSVEGMPMITRRKLLQLGGTAAVSGIVLPMGERVSEEEQTQFTQTMGDSIRSGWKLFNTTNTSQVVTIGQALLTLVHQNSLYLLPSVRPLIYSSVYRLVGAALHFHGYYDKAYRTHEQAYISALEGVDLWNMVQCRIWQANGLMEQKRYSEVLQTNEAALRLISYYDDLEIVRLKAKILSSDAECAAFLGENKLVQEKLHASKTLLEQFPQALHDEFDYISWHQSAGTCALILGHHNDAINELQQAIDVLPANLVLRNVTILMPLAIAYARIRERDKCLEITTRVVQCSKELKSPNINQQFSHYLHEEIQKAFRGDPQINALTIG